MDGEENMRTELGKKGKGLGKRMVGSQNVRRGEGCNLLMIMSNNASNYRPQKSGKLQRG